LECGAAPKAAPLGAGGSIRNWSSSFELDENRLESRASIATALNQVKPGQPGDSVVITGDQKGTNTVKTSFE
jgi:hypothetical protein